MKHLSSNNFNQNSLTNVPDAVDAQDAVNLRQLGDKVDKNTLVFNVKDFGAAGDGTNDDAPAFQSALDACESAGGGTVFVPEGTYLLNSTPLVGNNTMLLGAGAGSILVGGRPSGGEGHALISHKNINATGYAGVTNIGFDNFAINSPKTNGITFSHAKNVYISRIYGIDVYQHFIDVGGVENMIAKDLYLTGKAGTATFQFNTMTGGQGIWTGTAVTNPNFDGTPPSNIHLIDSFITAAHASEHGQSGSAAESAIHFHRTLSQNIFIKNVVCGGKSVGMYKDPNSVIDNLVVDGCKFNGSGHGIYFEDARSNMSRDWKITKCIVAQVNGFGMRTPDCTNLSISECSIYGNSTPNSGVSLGGSGSTGANSNIINNFISGFATGIAGGTPTPPSQGNNVFTSISAQTLSGNFISASGKVKIGTFTLRTSPGTQAITGLGFRPKLVYFYSDATNVDDRSESHVGMFDGITQFVHSSINRIDGVTARRTSTTQCIKLLNSTNATDFAAASGISLDTDGFTLNVTTTGAGGVAYVAME